MSGAARRIVVLGMMTKMPVAGVVWQNLHYLLGFKRLGYDVCYVETHARVPSMLMEHEDEDASALAAAFIDSMLRPFGLGGNWAYVALHDDAQCYGLSSGQLRAAYDHAELILNLHGGTAITPELASKDTLVYLETDPVQLQLELQAGVEASFEFLEPHRAFFTFAECLGNDDCRLPVCDRFVFHPTRQPVVSDLWKTEQPPVRETFTTIGNWLQQWRDVTFEGETYTWSKADEFLKVIDLPRRTGAEFELALASYLPADRALLESHGWRVRPGISISTDPIRYRTYVRDSQGEFTVAKDQNVRFRTGWFSDRSATYLAAARPVITQDTGFTDVLPTGEGLFAFSDLESAVAAVEQIRSDYIRASAAAHELSAEYFEATRVLSGLLEHLGLRPPNTAVPAGPAIPEPSAGGAAPLPANLVLEPVSRWPTRLPETTAEVVGARPLPEASMPVPGPPVASVVIPTFDNYLFLRMCLESLLADPAAGRYEIIVVDNGSTDGSAEYLGTIADRCPRLAVVPLPGNRGFAHAVNRGLERSTSERLIILNDDTIPVPGSLDRLLAHLEEPTVGIVGASTNRSGNEAEVPTSYQTYGEMVQFAEELSDREDGLLEASTVTLFCAALRRDVYQACGGLDEDFGLGLFEDDDYSVRVRRQGYRVVVARDVFAHHFGQATVGKLAASDGYGELFHANRRRFEAKWNRKWHPHSRRANPEYEQGVRTVTETVSKTLPLGAAFAILSSGDEGFLDVPGRRGQHFPVDSMGVYSGYHPASDADAIQALDLARAEGIEYLVVPFPSLWWLSHYVGFETVLRQGCAPVEVDNDLCMIFDLQRKDQEPVVSGRSRIESESYD